jgi:hypothetical protein
MQLSKRTLETLIDLVENKLSSMEVWDRGDRRELNQLQQCLRELTAVSNNGGQIDGMGAPRRRRGRPPKLESAVL